MEEGRLEGGAHGSFLQVSWETGSSWEWLAGRPSYLYSVNILLDDGTHPCLSSAQYDPPLPASVWQWRALLTVLEKGCFHYKELLSALLSTAQLSEKSTQTPRVLPPWPTKNTKLRGSRITSQS
jgi:hypothetical protein